MRTLAILALFVAAAQASDLSIHTLHREKLGSLDCGFCHTPVHADSVTLQRPGHAQCRSCHDSEFVQGRNQKICVECHAAGSGALVSRPSGSDLTGFSHLKHTDPKARLDPRTGFRADCTFCHALGKDGEVSRAPTHEVCAACHAKAGFQPQLTSAMKESTCAGCHTMVPLVASKYDGIKFSHGAHFSAKDKFKMDCATCHSGAGGGLPSMIECVGCHETSKRLAPEFRMANCKVCHDDRVGGSTPASHSAHVKPASHNESFRILHAGEASRADANCFVCHQNSLPSLRPKDQCVDCHAVMRPASHTARWKEDTHGKYASLDRGTCAACHSMDYCSKCHNELPRSHAPLPMFKAGGHAMPAMLDQRACLTCHTFQNTCSACHTSQLTSKPAVKK